MFSNLRVQKYGGTSVDSTEKIKAIANQVRQGHEKGDRFLIIVSAMGQTTNDLTLKAKELTHAPNQREHDMLLTAGERVSIALMSLALNEVQVPAISFTGSQAGIMTDGIHGNASIIELRPHRVVEELEKNKVVVIAGFQGVSPQSKDVTTLGRGGSDLTAIAMAHHFSCSKCEFMKDTEGIFNQDPNSYPQASHIPEASWGQVVHWTKNGASFLHHKAALLAQEKKVPLVLRHAHKPGGRSTLVGTKPAPASDLEGME